MTLFFIDLNITLFYRLFSGNVLAMFLGAVAV